MMKFNQFIRARRSIVTGAVASVLLVVVLFFALNTKNATTVRHKQSPKLEQLMFLALDKSNTSALEELRRHADIGTPEAKRSLGVVLLRRGETTGIDWIRSAATSGDLESSFILGKSALLGTYTSQNYDDAFRWLSLAANGRHPEAAYYLGVMYRSGYGVPRDNSTARTWFERAAQLKSPAAFFALGNIYRNGEAVKADERRALEYYLAAANMDHPEAMQVLAMAYKNGELGLKRDESAASFYFSECSHALKQRSALP